MTDRELRIHEEIRNEVFDKCFRSSRPDKYQRGRDILYRIYLKEYNRAEEMETKRIILYNLIFAEKMLGNEDVIKQYILQLKNDMDETDGYKESNPGDYINMLSCYCDCKGIELSNEEKIQCYEFNYNYYKKLYKIDNSTDVYIRMINTDFNIKRVIGDVNGMVEIVYVLDTIKNAEAESLIIQAISDIRNVCKKSYEIVVNNLGIRPQLNA